MLTPEITALSPSFFIPTISSISPPYPFGRTFIVYPATSDPFNPSYTSTTSTSEAETLSSAKSLANSMGLVVASDATAEDIINQISTKIRQLATSSSQSEREMAQAYQTQLNSIATQYQALQNNQTNMYSAMNMMSINNKYSLNL